MRCMVGWDWNETLWSYSLEMNWLGRVRRAGMDGGMPGRWTAPRALNLLSRSANAVVRSGFGDK